MPHKWDLELARSRTVTLRLVRSTYPLVNWLHNRRAYYMRRAPFLAELEFDEIRFWNRGNEPEAHVKRIDRFWHVKNSDVLICGVGDGSEVAFWLDHKPKSLTAVDALLDHDQWCAFPTVSFARMDVRDLRFPDQSFDVVASIALLEHVDGIQACISEMARVTRSNGVVFAGFGPLWHTYGGPHYLGSYEHLWLTDQAFAEYLQARAIPEEQREALHWLKLGMFSRRTYEEYLEMFRRYFSILHVTAFISNDGLRFKQSHPAEWASLLSRWSEKQLLVSGAAIWARPKRRDP